MRQRILLFCLLFISELISAQTLYSYYKDKYFSSEDTAAYNNLLIRFQKSDTSLRLDDFKDLYFGAIFLNSYNPEKIGEAEEKIRQANFSGNYQLAYNFADSLLKNYPMSIQAYFEKSWACHNLGLTEEEEYNKKRYKVLIRAIMDVGDGLTAGSAWFSNLPNDEFEVIKFLKFEIKEEREISYDGNVYDVFTLKANKSKIKEIYFNVTCQGR